MTIADNDFLNFIEEDIKNNPQKLASVNQTLLNRIQSLAIEVEFDLNEPLSKFDE